MGFHIELEAVIRGDLDPAADRPRTRPEYRAVQTHGGGPLPSWDANCIRKYPGEVAREIGGIQLEYVPDSDGQLFSSTWSAPAFANTVHPRWL